MVFSIFIGRTRSDTSNFLHLWVNCPTLTTMQEIRHYIIFYYFQEHFFSIPLFSFRKSVLSILWSFRFLCHCYNMMQIVKFPPLIDILHLHNWHFGLSFLLTTMHICFCFAQLICLILFLLYLPLAQSMLLKFHLTNKKNKLGNI